MIHSAGRIPPRIWAEHSGPYRLLILLFVTIFVPAPLISARMVSQFILEIAFALILVAGAFNVTSRAPARGLALVLAVLSVVIGKLWGCLFSKERLWPWIWRSPWGCSQRSRC